MRKQKFKTYFKCCGLKKKQTSLGHTKAKGQKIRDKFILRNTFFKI